MPTLGWGIEGCEGRGTNLAGVKRRGPWSELPSGLQSGENKLVESWGMNLHTCTQYRWPGATRKSNCWCRCTFRLGAKKKKVASFFSLWWRWRWLHGLSINSPHYQQGSSESSKVQGQQELLRLNFHSRPEILKRHINIQAREVQAVLTQSEKQLALCSLCLLLSVVNCHDFTEKFIVSAAFPNSWDSWSCMHVFYVSLKAWTFQSCMFLYLKKKAKAVLVFFFIFIFKSLLGFTGMKDYAGPRATEHPTTEVSTMGVKVLPEKPTPELCIPWAAEVNAFTAEGRRAKLSLLGHGPGQCRCSNLRLQQLDLGNVTETWRIVKTWKYLLRECVSLTAPVKEIAEKYQLTNIRTAGAALPQMTNPSHWGMVIAAPLQTVSSPLRGKAIRRRQTTPSPCKLPHFLRKYPSSNPKNQEQPSVLPGRRTTWSCPSPPTQLPPGERNQIAPPSRSFSIQRAEGSGYRSPGLLGVVSHLNWVKWVQRDRVLPKAMVVAVVTSLLTQNPFLTLEATC